MTTLYRTTITRIGPEVADLLDGGVLILFAEGAPPELAEVSVLHAVAEGPAPAPPAVGARLTIGEVEATLTAIGGLAWNKIAEMGHVVINFDGATASNRPGELSASVVPADRLLAALVPGSSLAITA